MNAVVTSLSLNTEFTIKTFSPRVMLRTRLLDAYHVATFQAIATHERAKLEISIAVGAAIGAELVCGRITLQSSHRGRSAAKQKRLPAREQPLILEIAA